MAAPKLLTLTEAATALDPHVAPLSAISLLLDWRRAQKRYRPLTTHVPRFVRISRSVFYTEEEIARTIAGVQDFKSKRPVPS